MPRVKDLIGDLSVKNLNDMSDVSAASPGNGEVLRYNTTSGVWENDGEDAVALNTTHRSSDGKDHSDVVLNNTHRATAHDYAQITANDGATDVTAAELEELTDASETSLHSHAATVVGFDSKVSVYRNITQNITQNTWTKLTFTAETYDVLNEFDYATNHRFKAAANGYYHISASTAAKYLAAGTVIMIRFVKNGAEVVHLVGSGQASNILEDGNYTYAGVSADVYLAANDYIEVEAFTDKSGGVGVGEPSSNFTAHRFA